MYHKDCRFLSAPFRSSLTIVALFSILLTKLTGQSLMGGQMPVDSKADILVVQCDQEMHIDGILDEPAWFKGIPATDFWQNFPSDSVLAQHQTEIYFTYDDQQLYVGVKCFSSNSGFVIPSLRRDYNFSGNDNISILFDTYNDETNAFPIWHESLWCA